MIEEELVRLAVPLTAKRLGNFVAKQMAEAGRVLDKRLQITRLRWFFRSDDSNEM
jgi:hypothetical protein